MTGPCPDIPATAIRAAAEAIERELLSGRDYAMALESDEALARAALQAAEKVWPHKPAGFIVQTQPNPRGGTIGDRP